MPVDVNLLGKCDGSIVIGDRAKRSGVAAGQGNAVVDIEETRSTARRPDDSRGGNYGG